MMNSQSSRHYQLSTSFTHFITQHTIHIPISIHNSQKHSEEDTTPIHSTNETSFPFPTHEGIALLLLRSHPPPSLYVLHGWNRVRRALGECAPHFIQRGFFTQSNYALMNTTAFIVYGLSKFITSHVVKGNLFRMYTLLFGMVGILCSLEGLASSSTTGNYSVFFALWVVGYACMGTLWPILCIVFKQWLPDDCTPSSSY